MPGGKSAAAPMRRGVNRITCAIGANGPRFLRWTANNQRESESLSIGLLLAFEQPALDLFGVKTPVAADPEPRQLPCFEQAIDSARMYFQVLGEFPHGQYCRNIRCGFHGSPLLSN